MAVWMSTRRIQTATPGRPHWLLGHKLKWTNEWRCYGQPGSLTHPEGPPFSNLGSSASLDLLVLQEKLKIWTCKENFFIFKSWEESDFLNTLNGQIKHICRPEGLPLGALGQRVPPRVILSPRERLTMSGDNFCCCILGLR